MEELKGYYYVLFANSIDMYNKENPLDFGPAYNYTNSKNQTYSYYKQHRVEGDFYHRDKEIRLYDSKNKHCFMKKEEVESKWPEMFLPFDGAKIGDFYYRLSIDEKTMFEYRVLEVYNWKLITRKGIKTTTITITAKTLGKWMNETDASEIYPEYFV